ncbi:uncharacterized protein Z518_05531 [Rhinocladiella mackenziei CBS 650.93]|uniref:G-patch domain-containing protein n=1 Tax=Rhinocladiella mackenziei CBS 650.93 TaxID=1442369 RepID=A0A0D2INF1_9EURO|nr:uncharacterized protein Z518_05531 [Rhinocladiella mackenziei CBS 650.93]KIX04661.1 hypothetical protein Z518_05531 [Rhinocladiella mackenziei CBS 650.93]
MANDPPAPSRGGLSLYANLLDPKNAASGTISSAPVSYTKPESTPEQDEAVKKQQALAASLRFQPTKRPQIAAQKAKAKAIASKFALPSSSNAVSGVTRSESTENTATEAPVPQPSAPKTTLADWVATASDDDEVNHFYAVEKRERPSRKKRKKNKEASAAPIIQDWDDIYDPSRPNNYEEYKHSEEKIREVREWKDLLYRHRIKPRDLSDSEDDDYHRPMNNQFAPPPMSFAPPPNLNDECPSPPPPADIPDDTTGEDAYLRRIRMSQAQQAQPPLPPPPAINPPPGQITRAPIRYNLPSASEEIPSSEAEWEEKLAESEQAEENTNSDEPRSKRPGQAGFAERLMSKYGWSKGQGLGAQGTGIINPLYAKVDKRKKKSDAEGGGYAAPAGTGKIMGGYKSKAAQVEEEGRFGAMSEVVRLEGMLNGLNLDDELTQEEGGILQEIGEECSEKYGSVKRVYIHRSEKDEDEALVFVCFVSQLSALRAVNTLEGRIFNGNPIKARFWPKDKFDEGHYV